MHGSINHTVCAERVQNTVCPSQLVAHCLIIYIRLLLLLLHIGLPFICQSLYASTYFIIVHIFFPEMIHPETKHKRKYCGNALELFSLKVRLSLLQPAGSQLTYESI